MTAGTGSVVVAGSLIMDVTATVHRHPVPGETLMGQALAFYPGGKGANQALAARRLGAAAVMVGAVGGDAFGEQLLAFFGGEGVDLAHVRRVDAPTGASLVTVNPAGENTIVVTPGANLMLDAGAVDAVPLAAGDVVLAQLEIPLDVIVRLFRRAREVGARTVLNLAPALEVPPELPGLADIAVVNENELAFYAGLAEVPVHDETALAAATRAMRGHGGQTVIVTLGGAGAVVLDGNVLHRVPGTPVKAVDTTGAGDCFVGALASRLVVGQALLPSLVFANAAAAVSVQRPGAGPSLPRLEEVRPT